MTENLERHCPELSLALKAARLGGNELVRLFNSGVTIREKAKSDLVSDADIAAEQQIIEAIHEVYPDHDLLAEESHAEQLTENIPEHLWIIDPLDGTTNFAHGLPHFAVSIAYYRNGRPHVGVVYKPVSDDWYVAVHGQGAFHNGSAIRVADHEELSESLIGVGFYYDRGRMMECTLSTIRALFKNDIHGIRRFGTASLDLVHVALGMYGAFFEYQLSPWDFAAGRLIVEEAGGRVTTALGEELPLRVTSVVATNGQLHPRMLEIIQETASELFLSTRSRREMSAD